MEQVTLYYRQGSSDKIYQASIEPRGNQFVVNFAYGRRGTTLQTGTKTQAPVNYDTAKGIFEKLIKEKTAKGYTPGKNGTPYQQTEKEDRNSGIQCQLLNAIDESELQRVLRDPAYWMQQKFDGRRLLIRKEGDQVMGINRLGLIVSLPASIEESAKAFAEGFIIDGEAVGETLHAFDLLRINGEDMRERVYAERYFALLNLIKSDEQSAIPLVPTACMPKQKAKLFQELEASNAEGVVFKRLDATYSAGRPASGGAQLKYKFYETATLIVSNVNAKRSVALTLLDGKQEVQVGNVTIPANQKIPNRGDLVEVRYLYAFEGGSIYQPVYLGTRQDVTRDECSILQLKFKRKQSSQAA